MIEQPQELLPQILDSHHLLKSQKYAVDEFGFKELKIRARNSVEGNLNLHNDLHLNDDEDKDDEKEIRYRERTTLVIQLICGVVIIGFIIGYCACFAYFVAFKENYKT